nr:unnamed protein product [Digitaria exilis]
MGGLRAAAPSPAPSGAARDPPAPPRVAMACVVASEVAAVLAVMRRNVRWGGVRYDGGDGGADEHLDHPLIAGLKSLRRRAAGWGGGGRWRDDVDPLLYLRPFLDVVRSDETGAPITGAALSSLHKMLSLDLVGPAAPNVAEAMGAVVDAVTGCRFEVTDPASEEAVLARVLQVLLACVRGRAAPALSNRHVCAIVSTCFRVVQQAGTKGELLQRVSRQTMQEVIRCVFARLLDLDATMVADEQIANCKGQGLGAGELDNGRSEYVCLNSSGDEVGSGTAVAQDKAMMELFGVPCMVEILQFLCSLLNVAEDIEQKGIKKKLMVGVEHFNRDKKKGFEFLQGAHLLPEKLDPHNVALFFRYTPGLDKNLLGEYLGNHDEFSIQVLHEFARTFDFKEMNLDAALRLFLETFRLPVATISVVFDNVEDVEVLTGCIDGFLSVAKLAAFYRLDDVLNDLLVALCKFTTLLSSTDIDEPVTAFGEDTKARMATVAVFTIATTYGDHIRSGWRSIVDCILKLHKIGLLPSRLTGDTADDQNSSDLLPSKLASSAAASPVLTVSASKKSYGLMGRFSQLLYYDSEEPRSQPTEQQLAAQRNASETAKKCQVGTIFTESKFLQADSLSNLARALILAAGRPQKITGSFDGEGTSVFCLELLITITLNNRDRIVLLWQGVYEHIAHIVQSTVMPCNLVEKAVFGLLHICQRLLPYKENLVDDLLRSLQLILKLDARVADAYCENITLEVARLVKASATHINSQMGWRTIISLICITARHPDASDSGFETLVFIMSEGSHLSPTNFVFTVEASRQFAESRLGSTERSIHALNLMADSVNCLARWTHEVKEAGGDANRILEGIAEMWLRLVQALRKLLDELLEIAQNHSPKDFRNMEMSLLHAVKLLCKVFLQSLKDLSAQSSFGKLWLEVLDMIERFVKVKLRGRRSEKLQEAIPELVKNVLMVMKASGILSKTKAGENSLWEATWLRVNNISPVLQSEVFPDNDDNNTTPGEQNKLYTPTQSDRNAEQ